MTTESTRKAQSILLNMAYWPAMGHCMEGLRYSLGYHLANPDATIGLVLNDFTTHDLVATCPWINAIYTVPIADDKAAIPADALQAIPTDWDYLIADRRLRSKPSVKPDAFQVFQTALMEHLGPTTTKGYMRDDTLPYVGNHQLSLQLPANATVATQLRIDGPENYIKIAVLLAGGSYPESFWPSAESWNIILRSIADGHGQKVQFYLIGNNRSDNQHLKTRFSTGAADSILANTPHITDCRQVDLLGQLEIIKHCRLFVSPHSGFAFGALAVGTPWLTISGGRWHEYFFNDVPFYSLLADPKRYPVYTDEAVVPVIDEDGSERIPSMLQRRFVESVAEIGHASQLLTSGALDYDGSMRRHVAMLAELGLSSDGFFDDAAAAYRPK